jgi:hypothetical protein
MSAEVRMTIRRSRPDAGIDFPPIEWPATGPGANPASASPAPTLTTTPNAADREAITLLGAPQANVAGVRPQVSAQTPGGDSLRKRRPSSPMDRILHAQTRRWLLELPRRYRPRLLPVQYPHILNRLSLVWTDALLAEAYFADLLMDRRGGRIGFPRDVTEEILRLNDLHMAMQDARYRPLRVDVDTYPAWLTTARDPTD